MIVMSALQGINFAPQRNFMCRKIIRTEGEIFLTNNFFDVR